MDHPARRPRKKALCVGLNYPRQNQYKLYGCVNDCLNWEHLLKTTFGFDETRVLIDQHPEGQLATAPTQIPNRDNILAQLGWLCNTAEPGDCLCFVYAGHGCQVRNSNGEVDQALVPEDFGVLDERGNPPLVMDDELHALFQRLPAGSFLTMVLDCCHASRMLDVDCSLDSAAGRAVQRCDKPQEVRHCTAEAWQKMFIPNALARPRFIPTVAFTGPPRPRRIAPGVGAHVGRMTLDPGVTAFSFYASRPAQSALDANIKEHMQGVMSFCLQEALVQLRHRCTYQQLLEEACKKLDDIRKTYMPGMDQYIQLSFCPNSTPSQVVVLDAEYATVAQHRLYQRAKLAERGQSGEGGASPTDAQQYGGGGGGNERPTPYREASSDFVPSPMYQAPAAQANHSGREVAHVYVHIHAAHSLKNTDTGMFGDKSDPYVVAKVGKQEKRTPTVSNELNPVWKSENEFHFGVEEQHSVLDLAVWNSNVFKDDCIGRTGVDLLGLPPGQWHRRTDRLRDGSGELVYDVRIERPHARDLHLGGNGPSRPQRNEGPLQNPHRSREYAGDAACAGPACAGPAHGGGGHRGKALECGAAAPSGGSTDNLFGTPNLFGTMPNLLAAIGLGGPQPQQGMQMPGAQAGMLRTPSVQGAMPPPGRPLSVQAPPNMYTQMPGNGVAGSAPPYATGTYPQFTRSQY
mmetsp:Transcript_41586/g.114596  ORF Transcript_41586/g.114596 Transcript_41586/m.114596 type:complete len:687 (-) Transcript_41586:132-2192(-)